MAAHPENEHAKPTPRGRKAHPSMLPSISGTARSACVKAFWSSRGAHQREAAHEPEAAQLPSACPSASWSSWPSSPSSSSSSARLPSPSPGHRHRRGDRVRAAPDFSRNPLVSLNINYFRMKKWGLVLMCGLSLFDLRCLRFVFLLPCAPPLSRMRSSAPSLGRS